MSLPMRPSHDLIWIWRSRLRCGGTTRMYRRRRGTTIVVEDIQAFEFLVEDSQRLKALRLDHLCLEPIFGFILFDLLQVLVRIVKVPVQL